MCPWGEVPARHLFPTGSLADEEVVKDLLCADVLRESYPQLRGICARQSLEEEDDYVKG